jgi:TonB-dependent receptor
MRKVYIFLSIFFLISNFALGQRNGRIAGKIIDASNGEPLSFANVALTGTSIGTISDDEGLFTLSGVPVGDYVLVMRYVGYNTREVEVSVTAGETSDIGIQELEFASIMGEVVTVTGQLRGQASAINQQVKSNRIVNVVSREKIEEVPDANAAESLSRLPGITIGRSGGEGSQITVRGVSPRFNAITINGQTLPSTGANDRSVNLSMVSSDLLDGIEVYKAITPDMDADAIGGTVNLTTKVADAGLNGRVHLETGYHSLINDIGTYRGSFTASNRILDDKLGLILGGNYHRANRNVDFFDGDYELKGDGGYRGNVAEFVNRLETRDRYGISGALDYKFKNGKIILDHVYSQTTREVVERSMRARPTVSTLQINIGLNENSLVLNSTNLRGDFELFEKLNLAFNFGRSKTSNETPYSFGAGANKESGLTPEADNAQPLDMFRYAKMSLDEFYGGTGTGKYSSRVNDENYIGQLDFTLPFNISSWLTGDLKFGGKIRQKQRERIVESYSVFDWTLYNLIFRDRFPHYERNGNIYPLSNFIDPDYTTYDSRFEPHNDIPFVFNPDIIREHHDVMTQIDTLFRRNAGDYFQQYDAKERITAGYVMAEIRLGPKVTFIPGFRYENTSLEFTGGSGTTRTNEPFRITIVDTTATNSIGEFLPMFHLKYEFLQGFSLRLAATKTLSRPNFLNLTPFTHRHYANFREVTYGSIELEIPTAWNYDAMFTWFSKYGLLSVGGFYKEIYDVDINVNFFDYAGTRQTNPWYGWRINSPINLDETTKVYGGEMELQTNLRFLPKPFDGIILSGNYSVIRSEAAYPFYYVDYPEPDYMPTTADSVRILSMQGQANFIANATIGL